jgi:hypothetical protein
MVEGGDHGEQAGRGGVEVGGLLAQALSELGVGQLIEHGFDHTDGV